ncbi:MAG: AI-2E family transporter [Pseudomonadota bacterium]
MTSPNPLHVPPLQDKAFLLLVLSVTVAFAWILWPFFSAVFWSAVLAVLFTPLYRRLNTLMNGRRTPAALVTLLIIVVIVILPLTLLTGLLVQEATGLYARVKSGELNIAQMLQQMMLSLPSWATGLLDRYGLNDFAAVQERISEALSRSVQFLGKHALNVGQGAFDFIIDFFVMLYLLFFLLRDGGQLAHQAKLAIPLDPELQHNLSVKFTQVVRATMKGNVVIAIVQGALGGLIFWILGVQAPLLWAVVMAFLSLLPAVGTALVWIPVAVYFFVAGAVWQGVILVAFGVFVIGLVDNIARPILVGRDTKMSDYVILMATLGGMAIFGLNGFVIGPLIAAIFIAVWDVVATSRSSRTDIDVV